MSTLPKLERMVALGILFVEKVKYIGQRGFVTM